MPKKDASPEGEVTNSLARAAVGRIFLEIKPDGSFVHNTISFPMTGKISRSGNDLTFTPESMIGLNRSKYHELGGSDQVWSPTSGTVSSDGKRLTVLSNDTEEGANQIFERYTPPPMPKPGPSTVTKEEEAYVGVWKGHAIKFSDEKGEKEFAMASAALPLVELKLNSDNTFSVDVCTSIAGAWHWDTDHLQFEIHSQLGLPFDKYLPDFVGMSLRPVSGSDKFSGYLPKAPKAKFEFTKS